MMRSDEDEIVEDAFIIDVDGFEGPLALLLELARRQKVDLHKISLLALAEQYLAFVGEAPRRRLELAADYLVMAAWLVDLKSRLLLPEPPPEEEPSAEEMAKALSFRLKRLDAVRAAAKRLYERMQLGRDVFARGEPEMNPPLAIPRWNVSLYALLSVYARQSQRKNTSKVVIRHRPLRTLAEAREWLEGAMEEKDHWISFGDLLVSVSQPELKETILASTLAATLEMACEGRIDLRQDHAFASLWLRRRVLEKKEVLVKD